MLANEIDPLEPYYFEHEKEIICGREVTPITADFVECSPGVVDRFFTRFYYIKQGADDAPYKVLFHSNRVCLICLAPGHPALEVGVSSLNFNVGNADRSKNAVRGKGKKGGMVLQSESTLALLTSETGKVYKVPSCIRGKLLEVNLEVAENPKLLKTAAEGHNYLAIILPKPEHCDEIKASLIDQANFDVYLTSKQNGSNKSPI